MTETTAVWLTQDAYDKLSEELAQLSGEGRRHVVERIAAARAEGDLSENGGYHAAREEQAKVEARIRELTEKLRHAHIGTPPDDGVIEPGMVVTALVGGEEMTFLLGSREIAGTADVDVYSPTSPLGEAINGLKVGDVASYRAPSGAEIPVEVRHTTPFTG